MTGFGVPMHFRRVAAVLFLCALPLAGQLSNGGNGDLETTPMAINSNFALSVSGGANQPFSVWISDGPASIPTPYGSVSIDILSPAFSLVFSGNLSPAGAVSVSTVVPNDPNLLSVVGYLQGAVIDPGHQTGVAITRAVRIQFESPDSFVSLQPLAVARAVATGNLLNDGRVFVAGGDNGSPIQTTEIYQPFSRTWSPGPGLMAPRSYHASTMLNDGRVLLCGGSSTAGIVTQTCEIFDPVTQTMVPVASMGTARAGHAATTLSSGQVLVTGGSSFLSGPALPPVLNASLNTGEVYDPVADTWTPVVNPMASRRFLHAQSRLVDGRVLCVAGFDGSTNTIFGVIPTFTATCSFYDPATNTFSSAASIPVARGGHRATLMPNGEVFVGGGVSSSGVFTNATADARKYSPTADAWTSAGSLPVGVALHGQVLLKSGTCHISGGATGNLLGTSATNLCESRTAGAATFTPTTAMPEARRFHLAVLLQDGSVLIAGGGDTTGALGTTLLYTPTP